MQRVISLNAQQKNHEVIEISLQPYTKIYIYAGFKKKVYIAIATHVDRGFIQSIPGLDAMLYF